MSIPRKYGLLRVIAFILKLLGWLVLAAGISGAIVVATMSGRLPQDTPEMFRTLAQVGALAAPIIAIVWFVQLFAFGSVLSMLIEVEEKTRGLAARPPA